MPIRINFPNIYLVKIHLIESIFDNFLHKIVSLSYSVYFLYGFKNISANILRVFAVLKNPKLSQRSNA